MKFITGLVIALMITSVSASASSDWASNDKAASAACIKASGFRAASVTQSDKRAQFGDEVGFDALLVSGIYPQTHMRGQRGTVLCLWKRGSRKAYVSEVRGWRN